MHTHTEKIQQNTSKAVANSLSKQQSEGESELEFEDNRPVAIQMKNLQEIANNSPQIRQSRALQEMVNNSSQVKKMAQLQAITTNHSVAPIQREEDELKLKREENNTVKLQEATNNSQVFQFVRKGDKAKGENPFGYYTDDGKGPYNTRAEAEEAEGSKTGNNNSSADLKSTAWDGGDNTSLDFAGQEQGMLTMGEVLGGTLEVAGDLHNIRTDAVIQLYAGKLGIVAHVHVDTGKGGGMTQKSNRSEHNSRTPPNLTRVIMELPNFEKVKQQAIKLRDLLKDSTEKIIPRGLGMKLLEAKCTYAKDLGEAKNMAWNAGDIMIINGTFYEWLKPHKAGDEITDGDIAIIRGRLQGG